MMTDPTPLKMHRHPSHSLSKRGFTLVELAIVLAVVGLIFGGILASQHIIRTSELRSISTDTIFYKTAFQTFQTQYNHLPGDLPNATSYWGAIHTTHSNCIAQANTDGRATCNGNGDGFINIGTTYAPDGYERYHAWVQLANAGLITGSFSGLTSTSGSFGYTAGVNAPRGKLSRTHWGVVSFIGNFSDDSNPERFARTYQYRVLLRLAPRPLKPKEMWGLDRKMDDGAAATGKVFTTKNSGTWAPGCADSDAITANYSLNITQEICTFRYGFSL